MTYDTWPIELFWPSSVRWSRDSVVTTGGVAVDGSQRMGVTDGGGAWVCEMTIPLEAPVTNFKMARAIIEGLDGGATPIIVPYFAEAEAPYPLGGPLDPVPFSDEATFSDGTEFESSAIHITASAAPLRATLLTINQIANAPLEGGECYSVVHPTMGKRLYTIIRIPSPTQIKIRPPQREATTDDTRLDFDTPGCLMRLINASEALSAVSPPYRSQMTVRFREAF